MQQQAVLTRTFAPLSMPATGREIFEILGTTEARVVEDILDTHASRYDIMQALAWFDQEDFKKAALNMSSAARQVCEILLLEQGELAEAWH